MLHLFEACGIELEYMIVRQDDLVVAPVADRLIRLAANSQEEWPGSLTAGKTGWSNELVMHVVELKTAEPTIDLEAAEADIMHSIGQANDILQRLHPACMLLGTAMHPFFVPEKETLLWPHDSSEIYSAYNRIFGCRGHGWSNLQSMHLNLPFCNDEEFGRLHAAVRLLLPLLPALCASSPFLNSHRMPFLDTRLEYYRTNQSLIPSISGHVIPEPVYSMQEYHDRILSRIYDDIAPYDPDGILQEEWLNSRGAIARFDRMAIEIRTMDIQECAGMDIATAGFVFLSARAICEERLAPISITRNVPTTALTDLMNQVMRLGRHAIISDQDILAAFGCKRSTSVRSLLQQLLSVLLPDFALIFKSHVFAERIRFLIDHGPPAERMIPYVMDSIQHGPTLSSALDSDRLRILYGYLARCLIENHPLPCRYRA